MRVAIVHDWLVSYRGGEKVLDCISRLFPSAPIYTLFYDPQSLPAHFQKKDIRFPKFLNRFRRLRKLLLPILPSVVESIDLKDYDLVLSTSSCVVKGVIPGGKAKHICYIHSPMRYIWDQRKEYLGSWMRVPLVSKVIRCLILRLRAWDILSSRRVDYFIANSSFVQNRVRKYYKRESELIYPPVDIAAFRSRCGTVGKGGNYFLVAGAFVAYKRFDLAIDACNRLKVNLVVAGAGPKEAALRKIAGPTVQFMIRPADEKLRDLMAGAKAFLFPGVEDFGIIAVEAMAAGTPVIAFEKGGACDFIVPGQNGIFFKKQKAESLMAALQSFSTASFDPKGVSRTVEKFSEARFMDQFRDLVTRTVGV
ncbi:MAG: glycosyltransferase [Deltaproteobacteria bacterium]|nr:glycosyltransferase [Deltaproteobacteria bacterium]